MLIRSICFLAAVAIGEVPEPPQAPLDAVAEFAGNVLERGRDRWSGRDTPLLADGVNVETWEPVEWRHREGRYVICNFSNQQNLLRTLVGLSNLTGDERYRKAARDATAYMFEHFQAPCGLLYWGEHALVDLRTLTAPQIEDYHATIAIKLSSVLPFYELLRPSRARGPATLGHAV